MKVCLISDTHGCHRELTLPDADVLLHCGDITMMGELDVFKDFNKWLGELEIPHKIVIGGNHDIKLETISGLGHKLFTNAIYLENMSVEIGGIKFYGSPYTPEIFAGGHSIFVFNLPRGQEMYNIWKEIPDDVDVLITHGPPYQILDKTINETHAGCEALSARLLGLKPKLHVFGHIHENYGTLNSKTGTKYVNCSVLDEGYILKNKPLVVSI